MHFSDPHQPELVIGQMSGTSLDGTDLAACAFTRFDGHWKFEVMAAETIPYPDPWTVRLSSASQLSGWELTKLDRDFGHYTGSVIRRFIRSNHLKPLLIASHGHTVFHQPEKMVTLQIGSGSVIAAETGIPVVNDFRSADVALGGQGAPLVPVGDKLLFGDFQACLNLGGFGNVSFDDKGMRIAFDICPVNTALNLLAAEKGLPYDADGTMARKGKVNDRLLDKLNGLPYYMHPPPKSLGREWLEQQFVPVMRSEKLASEDIARTVCEHVAFQVNTALRDKVAGRVLVTGGGAHNGFLMERIRSYQHHEFFTPSDELIDFKEAIVFAFLGLLRLKGEVNVLASVTGSRADHSAGALHLA